MVSHRFLEGKQIVPLFRPVSISVQTKTSTFKKKHLQLKINLQVTPLKFDLQVVKPAFLSIEMRLYVKLLNSHLKENEP